MASQDISKLNQSSDFASMVSRGSVDLQLIIPDSVLIPANQPVTIAIDSEPAPNAHLYYARWRSSKNGKWKMTYQPALGADVSGTGVALSLQIEGENIVARAMALGVSETVIMNNPQIVDINVMFFDQPLLS